MHYNYSLLQNLTQECVENKMTEKEYQQIPANIKNFAQDVLTRLNAKNSKVYSQFDLLTLIMIIQFIVKLIQFFNSFKEVKKDDLNFLQRARLWVILKLSGVSGVAYSDVVDAVFAELKEGSFNDFKAWKPV